MHHCKSVGLLSLTHLLRHTFTGTIYGVRRAPLSNICRPSRYTEFRKMVMMTLYARQQKRHRDKEQTFGLCGRRRGWGDLRE